MYLIGIDLGTTGCKSIVFDTHGTVLGEHYVEYDLIFTPEGYVEQDAELWWHTVQLTIREAVSKAGIPGEAVTSMAVSSQGISIVAVDRNGNALQNAYSWYDRRSVEEARQIEQDYGDEFLFRTTGRHPSTLVLPQIMWIKKHLPEIYHKTWKFMMPLEFIQMKLTGQCITDYSMASGTLCYDTEKKCWMSEMIRRYGIDEEKLPEIGCMGDVVGKILPEVAETLGLSNSTIVALGGQDQKICATGASISPGVLTVSLGTATAVCSVVSQKPLTTELQCHGYDEDRWILECCVGTSGSAQKWVRNTIFPQYSYRDLDAMSASVEPGACGVYFFPFLAEDSSGKANGVFWGFGLQTKPESLIRAVQEGIAYEIRAYVEAQCRGMAASSLRVFGGGAKSSVWLQIISDVTGLPVSVPHTHETGCLGAAICAAKGAGLAVDMCTHYDSASYVPDETNHRIYDNLFTNYLRLRRVIETRDIE